MSDKIKLTKQEFEELYTITDNSEETLIDKENTTVIEKPETVLSETEQEYDDKFLEQFEEVTLE